MMVQYLYGISMVNWKARSRKTRKWSDFILVYRVCVLCGSLSMLYVFVCMWLLDIVAFIQFRFSLWSIANHARKLGAMYLIEMVYFRLFFSIETKMSIHFVFFIGKKHKKSQIKSDHTLIQGALKNVTRIQKGNQTRPIHCDSHTLVSNKSNGTKEQEQICEGEFLFSIATKLNAWKESESENFLSIGFRSFFCCI